jgi:4-hydroxy-tetrahydrodipicolinate synthase
MAEFAAQAGAAATVLSAPYYFPASQEDLVSYVEHFIESTSLPTFLYNMPSHTKISFEIDTLRRLIQHRQIVGLKDSSGYMGYLHQAYEVSRERENFSLLVGPERYLAETVLLGGHGGVSGGANLVPALLVALYESAAAGEREKAERLQEQVNQLGDRLYSHGSAEGSVIKGIKCALGLMGICDDYVAEPYSRHRVPEKRMIAEAVSALQEELSRMEEET